METAALDSSATADTVPADIPVPIPSSEAVEAVRDDAATQDIGALAATQDVGALAATQDVGAREEADTEYPGISELSSVAPELPHLPLFRLGEVYPLVEGQQIEFKHALQHPASQSKMSETVCGFLNSAGGFFIVGVSDDGRVVGVPRRVVDDILLNVDRIFHEVRNQLQ